MRFGFAASAPFGAEVLERLAGRHEIPFVLTQPDAPAGRGRGLRPAPAKLTAMKLGLPVIERARRSAGRADDRARRLRTADPAGPARPPPVAERPPVAAAALARGGACRARADGRRRRDRGHAHPARGGARRRADRRAGGVPDRAGGRRRVGVRPCDRPRRRAARARAAGPVVRAAARGGCDLCGEDRAGRPPARPLAARGSREPGPGALAAHRRPRGAERPAGDGLACAGRRRAVRPLEVQPPGGRRMAYAEWLRGLR